MTDQQRHFYRVGTTEQGLDEPPSDTEPHRRAIEPWLAAVFQSEHLSLLVGNGLPLALGQVAGVKAPTMELTAFETGFNDLITAQAKDSAKRCGRTKANLEDQLRVGLSILEGLNLLSDDRATPLHIALDKVLAALLNSVVDFERQFAAASSDSGKGERAQQLLASFLLSFASRTASRERLHLFTTNYDRVLEFGCEDIGLRMVDRFVGVLSPIFRSSRLDIDLHYNPPGIRGEPRFLEGVVRFSKLHGSVDWRHESPLIRRVALPFGAGPEILTVYTGHLRSLLVFPNPAKDLETLAYPYAELFRDFAAAICRPNSVLVTYGYGFGDDHINRVIKDALTIPSTHLVVISFSDADGRVPRFIGDVGRPAQISLLLGSHFGDLNTLVENYLPKPAIDVITSRKTELLKHRGLERAENFLPESGE
jgi:hypothetical protein